MFKFLKKLGLIATGMMLAPKKGVELRKDFVDYLKKYRPQLKQFIANAEAIWDKSNSKESDEVVATVEYNLQEIKNISDELDIVKTKELAYKALTRLGNLASNLGSEVIKSKNFKLVAKDLAKLSVDVIDNSEKIYSKVVDSSSKISDEVFVEGDSVKKAKEKTK